MALGSNDCIVDTGSHALVLDVPGHARVDPKYVEVIRYGSETVWCVPIHADLRMENGDVRRVECHRVVRRTRGSTRAGILGLAWCVRSTIALGGWWVQTPEAKRAALFHDSVWSLVPSAQHMVLDARDDAATVAWYADDLPDDARGVLRRPLQYFQHALHDGRTLQFIGWVSASGRKVLFETGATRSSAASPIKTTPPVDVVFGNYDMRGKRFCFDLVNGCVWVDADEPDSQASSTTSSNESVTW